MILIFFGSPGAGKGTQAGLISDYYKIPHLSTGDILRNKIMQTDEISKKIKNIMDNGQLVSDDTMNEIVADRISNSDCFNGFILDGYPRTIDQARFLNSTLKFKNLNIYKIIDIDVDKEIIIRRIKSRSNIENRQDDKEEVIMTRIAKYISLTKPVSDYYKIQHPLKYCVINGNQEIEKINADIIEKLKNEDL